MKEYRFLDTVMTTYLHFRIRRLFSTCRFHSHPVGESPTLFLALAMVSLLCKNEWKRQFFSPFEEKTLCHFLYTHIRYAHNQGVLFCQMDLKAVKVSVALFRCKRNKEKAIQIIFDMYVLMSNKNLANKKREREDSHTLWEMWTKRDWLRTANI